MSKASELAKYLTDAGLDGDALNFAVDVLRMKQSQPHHSMQTILWEAIKDYAERAHARHALASHSKEGEQG